MTENIAKREDTQTAPPEDFEKTEEGVPAKFEKNLKLIRAYRAGDERAGEELMILNKPLVLRIAAKFSDRGVDPEDLAEIGMLGLVKAVRSFDFSRECAFSTYAVPLVFGEIRRFLRDDGMLKVSREEKRLSAKLNAERERRLSAGESASIEDVARAVGVSPQDAASALFAGAPVRSLDEAAYADDEGTTLGQTVYDEDEERKNFDRIALRMAMERLCDFERKLILLRYFRDFSQTECAKVLGVTQVKVSREEKKILAKLRAALA